MIRTLLIDDEKDARQILRILFEKYYAERVEIVGEADDVDPGIEAIEKLQPDVIFLDVQMKTGTGFDILMALKNISCEVVFITAHNQFAVEAFKFSAFGYLLKPIKRADLSDVVQKLEKQLSNNKSDINNRLKILIENYGNDGEIKKLIVPNVEGFQVVKISDIIRLEGERNYTRFILTGGRKITTSKNLGEYENLLNSHGFFRIHQSTIVSLRHVSAYLRIDGGTIETSDGVQSKLSRHRRAEFFKRFS